MSKKLKKTALSLLTVTMATGMVAACGNNDTNTSGEKASTDAPKSVKYPEKLTYWVSLNANVSATMKNFNEMGVYKQLEKVTGTKVEFQHPPVGQEKEGFNLMIASGTLPDVIEYNWGTDVAKGPDNAIKEKTILRLNELIEQNAPNLSKFLKENPEVKKLITTDEGNIYVMPFVRGDAALLTFNGNVLRKDWLDKLGLPVPTTIDEWYTTLKAIKEKDPNGNGKADEIPFLLYSNPKDRITTMNALTAFGAAWGIASEFYQDGGKIKYGPMQPEFKDLISTLSKWYKEGLIDRDYAATDDKLRDAKVTGDTLGGLFTYLGSGIGRFMDLVQPTNPKFQLAGALSPVLKKGDKPILGQKDAAFTGIGAAISGTAKNPAEIVKWLDYGYGPEGSMLFNFGVEGESYKMENGYPKYTDIVTKNPDKLPMAQTIAKFARSSFNGPFIQDKRYMEQFSAKPEQQDAVKNWMNAENKKQLPPLTPTSEESSKYATIMNDVNTYLDQMITKFIMGAEPMENYDKFTAKLKSMGIEDAVKLKQAQLDRFNARK